MIERVCEIRNVGLFGQASGTPFSCKQATLIYADNGRGKSTLAAILRSLASNDPAIMLSLRTIDQTSAPRAKLQFGSGHPVLFENGAWSEQRSEVIVFDGDFINRNVHSGGSVSTDHRKNLLQFALGSNAVAAQQAADDAATKWKAAGNEVTKAEDVLSGHHLGLSLEDFKKLPNKSDIEKRIADARQRVEAAKNIAGVESRPVPGVVQLPCIDLDSVFSVLETSLEGIHALADDEVRRHIAKLGDLSSEEWLSRGQKYSDGTSCPYCEQDITQSRLIRAYQTYFNTAYASLKHQLKSCESVVREHASDHEVTVFQTALGAAIAQGNAWVESVPIELPAFDPAAALESLREFREFLLRLIQRKQASPAEPLVQDDEKKIAQSLWADFLSHLQKANDGVISAARTIGEYKNKLAKEDIRSLERQLDTLEKTKRRHEPAVIKLFEQLAAASEDRKTAEQAKKSAREALDLLMVTVLQKYEVAINGLLRKFGATFSIEKLNANFRGTSPRTEYGLLLRGKSVALEGSGPTFATSLSEGDKRTLAFAFFVASTLDHPNLAHRIVVIDDPMCSLDTTRRHHTRAVIKQIHAKAEQTIVLAHDSLFLRDMRDALLKDNQAAAIALFQLTAAVNSYTDFSSVDIDEECESPYAKNHRLVSSYCGGVGTDHRAVAEAIRPLLEGYLHRRFPTLLPKHLLFGDVVKLIRDADVTSPLRHAQCLVLELNEINDYAGRFHHNITPDASSVVAVPAEVLTYARRALEVIYKGTA